MRKATRKRIEIRRIVSDFGTSLWFLRNTLAISQTPAAVANAYKTREGNRPPRAITATPEKLPPKTNLIMDMILFPVFTYSADPMQEILSACDPNFIT
jgi:hypothetical protein